jgi:hypothetical protein
MAGALVKTGGDPAIQTPKAGIWMPGSRPGMTASVIQAGGGAGAKGGKHAESNPSQTHNSGRLRRADIGGAGARLN